MAQNDMKMQASDVLELHDLVSEVELHDSLVGRTLRAFAHHLFHAHGLDLATEQEKAAKQAEEDQKAQDEAAQQENAQIEQERADVRKSIDPEKEAIAVPVSELPSQQDKGANIMATDALLIIYRHSVNQNRSFYRHTACTLDWYTKTRT